ncbi:hypothetical protein QNI16_03725 [Cytophagaceae bacterium YF14B1]|uniref:Serine hydrolase n=1 Tax=Xanthocytophaga flava TaxID=3048013 RepID=A0AAE3U4A6_9BACT|nr:hypothetical protein [Xanthocytophaga flavus]MDJ1479579.1 hypothetical protein [Xanthocytophaga flavus]
MKTAIILFAFITIYTSALAQKSTIAYNKNKSTSTKMLITPSLKTRLIQFLHESFEDSKQVSAAEMNRVMDSILKKAVNYGLDNEADLATYVITSYVLGENFDKEVPEAAKILNNTGYNSNQKAAFLETWTMQVIQALENDDTLAQQVAAQQAANGHTEASMSDYLTMQKESHLYQQAANHIVELLIHGDAQSVIKQFSPNFMKQLGMEQVEKVFQTQMLPFFANAKSLGKASTVTMTHDAFGSEGFAFYLTLITPTGDKPFIVYMVNENNHIVLANLIINKTYADMH